MSMSWKADRSRFHNLDLIMPILLGLLVILTRLPFTSRFLFEWDSVNYALAFQNYNLSQEQPHAPGYLLYVGLGKVFNYIFQDPNTTMIFMAILFTIFCSILVYFMTKDIFSAKVAIISSLLFVFNPLIWFYGEIASIYIFEGFWAICIAYSCYKLMQGNGKFIYISAFFLGIAGGFRIETMELLIPLWLYCLYCAKPSIFQFIKGFLVFLFSIALWLVPTALLAGGISQYMSLLNSQSGAAGYTSILFGASLTQQLLNSGVCLAWAFLGITLLGLIIGLWFIAKSIKKQFKHEKKLLNSDISRGKFLIHFLKSSISVLLHHRKFMFFMIWIVPAFLFYLVIYIMKPGYLLNILPAVIIIISYALYSLADDLSIKFPKFSKNQFITSMLLLCIIANFIYFVFPINLHEGSIWETQVNQMTTAQEINYLIDVGFCYGNAKIIANDHNSLYNMQAIKNLSNASPDSTLIIIRDITREDEGFNWRKAMYYFPEHNVYYLFDEENAGMADQVSSWHAYNGNYNISMASLVNIPVNNSVTRIVWIMDDKSDFYQEVKTKLGIKTIYLANGLKVYYSDVTNLSEDIQISGFLFQSI